MKVLFFTDIHSEPEYLKILTRKAKDCDLIVCAGDMTFFGQKLKKMMVDLQKIGKRILLIFGNHEDEMDMEKYCDNKMLVNLHKNIVIIDDVTFCGFGGGGFTIFDDEMDEWVDDVQNKLKKVNKLVLVTHPPPFGTKLDKMPLYGHRGSQSVLDAIHILKPKLHISGHFHETFRKKDKIGRTTSINPGPNGMIIEI